MMEEKQQIEKLVGEENWATWRILMKVILECDAVYDVVSGNLIKPEPNSDGYAAKLAAWTTANSKAKKRLVLSLDTKPLLRVAMCETAKDVWEKLHQIYDTQSAENIDLLRHKFHNIEWEWSGGMQGHLAKFDEVQTKMSMLNKPIDEADLCARLLQTLPKEYDHIYVTWHDLAQEDKTWHKLQKRCLNYELRIQGREETSVATAMVSKSKGNTSSQQRGKNKTACAQKGQNSSKRDVKCFSCGKNGHVSKDCKTGLVCFKCKGKGHLSKNCPDRGGSAMLSVVNTLSEESPRMMMSKISDLSANIDMSECDEWFIDSGATHHVTNRRDWFVSYKPFDTPKKMDSAKNNVHIKAFGSGRINVETFDGRRWTRRYFDDVWYCPDGACNLFSVRKAGEKGIDQSIKNDGKLWLFYRNNIPIAVALSESKNELYRLAVKVIQQEKSCVVQEATDTLQMWHERFGHQSKRHVQAFLTEHGIAVNVDDGFCEGCMLGKQHRLVFGNRVDRATNPGELVFADVCGPMEEKDLAGYRYFLVFKDDFSGFRVTYLLRQKDEVKQKLPIFIEMVKTQANLSIKELRTDGGKEFDNCDVKRYAESIGLKHSLTVPYTPQQNGVAERENRIICEMARSWLQSAKHIPKALWGEAVLAATYTLNRTGPTRVKGKTPIELFLRKKSQFEHLKVFGTECFVWIAAQKRKKFDAKSLNGYIVGYDDCGYRVYLPDRHTVVVSRDVKFKNETLQQPVKSDVTKLVDISTMDDFTHVTSSSLSDKETVERNITEPMNVTPPNLDGHNTGPNHHAYMEENEDGNDITLTGSENIDGPRVLRDRKTLRKPKRYQDEPEKPKMMMLREVPKDYDEAVKSPDAENWKAAMDEEMHSHHKFGTWKLVDLPVGRKAIGNKWVFATKLNNNNDIIRYKARLVAKGFSQRPGVDFSETFSPVVRFETIRALLCVVVQRNWNIKQFDVKTAFLNGALEEEIYMQQPQGYDDGTGRVCRLLRSLYGLKQAAKCWYECLKEYLKKSNLQESTADPCVYFNENLIILFHVDDGLIIGPDEMVNNCTKQLQEQFDIVVSEVDCYLGFQIKISENCVKVNQTVYANRLLEKYGMIDANPISLPIEPGWIPGDSPPASDIDSYREIIGSLMYLTLGTRPDLTYAVNVASRAQDSPTTAHLKLVKRILRYLKGTVDHGIQFRKTTNNVIEAYSDADHAGDKLTRRSTSGVLMKYCGGPVMWKSKLQKCVAQSSMEAEFVAASEASKSLVWLDRLLKEIQIIDESSVPVLHIDNQSTIKYIKGTGFYERSKHIETRYHYVRQLFNEKKIQIEYISAQDQAADIFTKGLPLKMLSRMKTLIGMAVS